MSAKLCGRHDETSAPKISKSGRGTAVLSAVSREVCAQSYPTRPMRARSDPTPSRD
jgi:hypothetical protein